MNETTQKDFIKKSIIIEQATQAVNDIMNYMLEKNLATKEMTQKMAIIDDLILKYKYQGKKKKGEGQ